MNRERYLALNSKAPPNLTPEEIMAGWHYCYDWDGLLVGPETPEWPCPCCVNSLEGKAAIDEWVKGI